jgi:hypothetical protein
MWGARGGLYESLLHSATRKSEALATTCVYMTRQGKGATQRQGEIA